MRLAIQKTPMIMILSLVLLCIGMAGTLGPHTVSAASLKQNVSCSDGSTKLSINTKGANNTTVVSCASGADIYYITSNDTANNQPVGVTITCKDPQTVGSSVSNLNQANGSIGFYCVQSAGKDANGDPISKRTSSSPSIAQNTATGNVLCADQTTPAPGGDVSKCPASAQGQGNCKNVSQCDLITKYLNPFIKFLAALVGIAVVFSIIVGGIQYSSSAGDPQAVTAAKTRIRNAIIALVAFIFLFAMLNFLIPGGLV